MGVSPICNASGQECITEGDINKFIEVTVSTPGRVNSSNFSLVRNIYGKYLFLTPAGRAEFNSKMEDALKTAGLQSYLDAAKEREEVVGHGFPGYIEIILFGWDGKDIIPSQVDIWQRLQLAWIQTAHAQPLYAP